VFFLVGFFQEHRLVLGQKEIFHIEAFTAKVMAVYKRWCMEMMA
jgi:hypothetical protein